MACSTFLAGGEANTDPATAALSIPAPTNPARRNTGCVQHVSYTLSYLSDW